MATAQAILCSSSSVFCPPPSAAWKAASPVSGRDGARPSPVAACAVAAAVAAKAMNSLRFMPRLYHFPPPVGNGAF